MCYWLSHSMNFIGTNSAAKLGKRGEFRVSLELFALVGLLFGRFIQKWEEEEIFEENDPLKFDPQTPYRKKFLLKTIIWSFLP